MMYVLGVILTFAVMAFGVVITGLNPLQIADPASLIIVLFPAVFGALSADGWRGLFAALKTLFAGDLPDDEAKKRSAALFDLMGNVALGAGLVGALIGGITILANIDFSDPSNEWAKNWGRGLAAALVPLLYALFFKFFVFLPARERAAGR